MKLLFVMNLGLFVYIFVSTSTYLSLWQGWLLPVILTLTVLVATIDTQWEGMGDVGSARYEQALLSPMPDHKGFKLQ